MSVGIPITPPGQKIKADTGSIFDIFVDAAGSVVEGGSGLGGILKSLRKSVRLEESPGGRAFYLVGTCFAISVDRVFPGEEAGDIRVIAIKTMEGFLPRLQDGRYFLTAGFFDSPADLPLYKDIRDAFLDETNERSDVPNDARGQLDSAMMTALHAFIADGKDLFGDLRVRAESGAAPAQMEADWLDYRRHLIHEVEGAPCGGRKTRASR